MIGKMKGGGVIMDFINTHQSELMMLYIVGLLLLVVYLYYVFYYLKPSTTTSTPTNQPTQTPGPTKGSVFDKLKQKIDKLNELDVAKSLKGKLDTWGDDIDKLPEKLRTRAISCYQNPDGCVF